MITLVETPEDMAQLMRECIQVTYRWIDTCNKEFGLSLPYYKVVFGLKSGVAGKACHGKGIIQYNPTLMRENPVDFLANTTGHEVVHFANRAKHGFEVDSHGPEWKSMMVKLGLPPVRCHSYDVSNVPTRVFKRKRNTNVVHAPIGVIKTFGIGKLIDFD